MSQRIELGPFTQGERPEPLTYTFLDADDSAMDMTAYEGRFQIRQPDGTVLDREAVLEQSSETADWSVRYVWQSDDFSQAGVYDAAFWVGNGTHRFASVPLTYRVKAALGEAPNV